MINLAAMRLFLLCVLLSGCTIEKRPQGVAYSDDFSGAGIGEAWRSTGGNYRVENGELVVDHAYNHPLWLTKPLPRDCTIEYDAWSNDAAGDIKVEAWGDGRSFATTTSYVATSYVFIFGGWRNSLNAIARMNEHGTDRRVRNDLKVEKGKKYHFKITRRGNHIVWEIDGQPHLELKDAKPLDGPDHAYFAFNNWEAEVHFDNLKITPL